PLDLLRFRPLGLVDRLRLAALAAWARRRGSDPRLDEVSAAEWIRGFAGERAYRTVWEPLLRAKLGSAAADVPALWITSRLQREKNTARERKGVLRGGYRSLIDAIARRVRALGGELRLSTPVDAVELARGGVRIGTGGAAAEDFEFAVCTTPLPHFQGLSEGLPIDPRVRERKLDYQGVVCGVLFLDRAISPYYWTPFVDSGATAQGVVEMSNLMPLARSAGRHVNYFVNYCHRESELFQSADDALLGRYRDDLASLYPNSGASVLEAHLFRAPFVEPMWTRGSLAARPPYEAIAGRLYSVSTSQLYPRVNSWNSCCELVEELMLGLPVSGASAP
ncbi:MAG: hypothetical protein HKP27_12240, partial [Myxococcales bacterium]|nr:hypothetical protein [Myxococcales bacterium]